MGENEKAVKALEKAAIDGRISCTMARKIAEEFQISPIIVGKLCNQLEIKIKACELGLFD